MIWTTIGQYICYFTGWKNFEKLVFEQLYEYLNNNNSITSKINIKRNKIRRIKTSCNSKYE